MADSKIVVGTMCYLRKNKETLFLYRDKGEGDIHKGFYVPPGGHVERGERSIDSIIREFEEETGLRLIDPKLRAQVTFYNEGRILGGEKDKEDWRVDTYVATRFKGVLKPEGPKDRLAWIPDSKVHDIEMHEGDRGIFGVIIKPRGVFEIIIRYNGEKLAGFKYDRVD